MSDTRAERARGRASWPITRHRLDEDADEVLRDTPPADCVAMVWALTLDAWVLGGAPIPDYARSEAPGRVVRPEHS